MNSGAVVVVGTRVVVGSEVDGVVLVLLKSFRISLRVFGFSEIYKNLKDKISSFKTRYFFELDFETLEKFLCTFKFSREIELTKSC